MDPIFWWLLAFVLIAIGLVGTFLPGIPGAPLVFGGMLLAAWIEGFQKIGWVPLVVLGVLTALTFVADVIGGLLGAKRVGASRLALLGAAIGAVFGIFLGFVGILFGPLVGAIAGELIARQRMDRAMRVGVGAWIGVLVGTVAKIALVFSMLAVFAAAYFIG
jgi:uncharacterized protein YqgC (DUF456 family)